jgi:hypothetical protein
VTAPLLGKPIAGPYRARRGPRLTIICQECDDRLPRATSAWRLSAFLFRLIAAHVAELTRPFDEAVLPVRAFLNGCSLVA